MARNSQSSGSDGNPKQSDPVEESAKQTEEQKEEQAQKEAESTPPSAPSVEGQNEALKKQDEEKSEEAQKSDSSDVETDLSKVKPTDERYNPYQDPAVTSSALADVIVNELADGKGKSPTLDSCRTAYEAQEKARSEG